MELSRDLLSAATIAVRDCMGTRPTETVLIVTDAPLRTIGYALREAAERLGNEVFLVEMLPRKTNGEDPPRPIAELMRQVDVVMCPTLMSLTHCNARREATAAGARVSTLPGVTEEVMIRCMNADYQKIAERTRGLCVLLERARTVRVTAPAGTDVVMPIAGRKVLASTGLIRDKGQFGNLPTGEAYLAPVEGESRGVVVVDGSMAGVGLVREPIRIEIEGGLATRITGGVEATKLNQLLEPHGQAGRTVAEFGIGTNDRAILTGVILEDEKVMGTIHIAFGDNQSMGGSVRVASHLDGLVTRPTVWLDETKIMEDGKLLVG
ncbi:MAG: aminopeptidase [Candidatus Riflebacteria bacterium]|nr:aminopeptidase [Candidatus Riflebacteria bacterium]